jgi:hypothetical protein
VTRRCKGECVPKLPGTIIYDEHGVWRGIYCAVCRHVVRMEPITSAQAKRLRGARP